MVSFDLRPSGGADPSLGLDLYWLSPTALSFLALNLTPLTARVSLSALLTIGVTSITMIRENDFKRVRLAAIAYTVYGALQWVNCFCFSNEVHWGPCPFFVYGAFMIVMLLLGAYFFGRERVEPGLGSESPS